MSEARKAIIISTGMDNLQLLAALQESEVATGESMAKIKGLYAKLSAEKAEMEATANAASLARLKENDAAKLAQTKAFFEAQAAMYAEQDAVAGIAQGSIPVNLGGKETSTAEGGVMRDAEDMAASGAAGALAAKGLKDLGKASHSSASIFRETAVLVREFFRRNFTRMIGSVSLLLQYMGITAVTVATGIPIIGAGVAGILGNFRMKKQLDAMQGDYGTDKAFGDTATGLDRQLTKIVAGLIKGGALAPGVGMDMQHRLMLGGMDDVNFVQAALLKLFPNGMPTMAEMEQLHRAQDEESRKAAEAARAQMTARQRLAEDMDRQSALASALATTDQTTEAGKIRYQKLQIEYQQSLIDGAKDQAEIDRQITEEKRKQAEAQKAALEKQKQIVDLERQLDTVNRQKAKVIDEDLNEDTKGIMSLEDLASGGGFMTRLKNNADRFNRGNLKNLSRQYIQQQYGMGHDFEQYSLATGGDYASWLKTDQGSGEKAYLDRLAGPLKALGIVKDTDLGTRLDDLNKQTTQIVDALTADGIIIKSD